MNDLKEDYASMMEWFNENAECFVWAYIEQNYKQCSWSYEYAFMQRHLIYCRAMVEDYRLSNEEKIFELLQEVHFGKSKIITIVGSRGSGKTATALFLGEEAHNQVNHNNIYYVGIPENPDIYPTYFRFVQQIEDVPNNSFAIIDEASIQYSARNYQQKKNKDLTSNMVIARHKGITLVIITQNLNLIDINIRRLSDIIIYKPGSDYGLQKKRGEVMSKMQKEKMIIMTRMKPTDKNECLIEFLSGSYTKYRRINHPLPTFWNEEQISKSHRHYKIQSEIKQQIAVIKDKPKQRYIPYSPVYS